MRERIRLPTDSDLSHSSLMWACELLAETPKRLLVSPIDAEFSQHIGDLDVVVDETLSCCSWLLEGETREVYSDGA